MAQLTLGFHLHQPILARGICLYDRIIGMTAFGPLALVQSVTWNDNIPPEKSLPEVPSVRLKVERCGVGGGFWEEGYV